MTVQEAIHQLKSLIDDRRSFLDGDEEHDSIYISDIESLNMAIKILEEVQRMNTSSEYSDDFDKLRRNRVEVSYFKYGPARKNFGEGRVDAIGSLELCLEKFKQTGNTEYLCDVANYAMFRFMYPMPGEYFQATDSSQSAGTAGTPINFER